MSFTVFLGNLPTWVTKDDIKSWLASENLVSDDVKVIRNPETQESKGFAFIESPNQEEMNSIIRRFDRAPLEDRLLRANPAQPPKSGKGGEGCPRNGPHETDRWLLAQPVLPPPTTRYAGVARMQDDRPELVRPGKARSPKNSPRRSNLPISFPFSLCG